MGVAFAGCEMGERVVGVRVWLGWGGWRVVGVWVFG